MVAWLSAPALKQRVLILSLLTAAALSQGAAAQAPFVVDVVQADLGSALRAYSSATGKAVAYDPRKIEGARSTCRIRTTDPEVYLACLLAGTGLEYFRRASGTYVIGPALSLPAAYGTVVGVVGEADSGEGIAYAHVLLGQTGRGAVTDARGRFNLQDLLPGRYAVRVSHLGYGAWQDSVDVLAGGQTRLSARLSRQTLEVEPVVVEQRGTLLSPLPEALPTRSVPASVGLSSAGFTDLSAGIHLQGAAEGDLQLRIDGYPVYLPRQLLSLVGPFSATAIGSIQVYQSGFGAATGSHLGGVLDFRQAVDGKNNLLVRANEYTVESSLQAARVSGKLGRLSARLAGRTSIVGRTQPQALVGAMSSWAQTDPFVLFAPIGAYERATEEELEGIFKLRSEVPRLGFSDWHANAEYRRPEGHAWFATVYRGHRDIAADRRIDRDAFEQATSGPLISSAASHRWNTLTAALGYQHLLSTRAVLRVDGRISAYRYDHAYTLAEAGDLLEDALTGQVARALVPGGVRDGNALDEQSLTAKIDVSRGAHLWSAGIELTHVASDFELRLASLASGERISYAGRPIFLTEHHQVRNTANQTLAVAWVSDRFERGVLAVESGVRLTVRPARSTVYAEPRLRAAARLSSRLAVGLSGGLYRQFLNQFDYSTLNAGEIVPSTRFWLPLDESVRPPRALHAALDLDWRPAPGWRLSAVGYAKRVSGAQAINYAVDPQLLTTGAEVAQRDLLVSRSLRHRGAEVTLSRSTASHITSVHLEMAHDRMQSPGQFESRSLSVPWSVPRRARITQESGLGPWSVSAQFTVEHGMKWALKQSYYDYFGSIGRPSQHGDWNLADPDAHTIPLRTQLDLGLSHRPWSGVLAHIRVINALNSRNLLDQRLLFADGALRADSRYLPGRAFVLGIQAEF